MNLLKRRQTPQSVERQLDVVSENSEQWRRDLNAKECKKVCQMQAFFTRQRNRIYDELNPTVKNARS